jgi:hypothetical protein
LWKLSSVAGPAIMRFARDESHKISDFYRVLYDAFGGCRIHNLGDAIESFNRRALSPERGLSPVRGRLLNDPEMTENKVAPIPDLMKMATIALGALVLFAAAPNMHRSTCEQECQKKHCHVNSKRQLVCQRECQMKCHLQRSEQQ